VPRSPLTPSLPGGPPRRIKTGTGDLRFFVDASWLAGIGAPPLVTASSSQSMVMRSLYFRVCGGVSHHGVLIARWSAWPPGGIAATGLDSIGDTGGMTGTCVDPFSRSAMTLPGLGQMNSPHERRSKPDLWPDHVCQAGRGARTDRGLSGGSAVIQAYPTLQISHNDVGVVTVAIDAPPLNLIGPELVRDLVGLVGALESDPGVRVMVLESADPEFFVPHVDLTKVAEYTAEAAKAGGPEDASLGMLWRKFSELPVVTIGSYAGGRAVRAANSPWRATCVSLRGRILSSANRNSGSARPRAPAVCSTSRGSWVGDEPWRCCWVPPTSTRMRPSGMAGSIGHYQTPSWTISSLGWRVVSHCFPRTQCGPQNRCSMS
jgi:hypothetical protein